MKIATIIALIFMGTSVVFAQDVQLKDIGKFPEATIKKLDGSDFSTLNIQNEGKPFMIIFWAHWCFPCIRPLDAIHAVYDDWVKETRVKIFLISVSINQDLVKDQTLVNEKQWKYEMLADVDSSLVKLYKSQPSIFILDSKQHVQYHKYGYALNSGDEKLYLDVIRKIISEKK